MLRSYNNLSSPAKLAAFIDFEMSEIGKTLTSMRQSIASLHRGEITTLTSNQRVTDISEKLYHSARVIDQLRIALIRKNQAYRTHVNKVLRIIRAMREISKIGESAQIDAIVVMQLQLISDAKRNLMQQKSEHVVAIRAVLIIQDSNWTEFWAFSDRIDAWLKEEADARAYRDSCPDGCRCQTCHYYDLYGCDGCDGCDD
jgi:hypothetical protein